MTENRPAFTRAYLDRGALADGGPMTFTASSTAVNRYGYALRNDGWRLANYEANPVVLWAHNPSIPTIGRSLTALKDDTLLAEITFDAEDELARQVESKYRRGFLSAVSVGFDMVDEEGAALAWWSLSAEKIHDEVFYDLAEISAVPVPGDPKALKQQQRSQLATLGRELVDLFDEVDQPASDVTAPDLEAAVLAVLNRLGISTTPAETATIPESAAQGFLAALKI